jgi:FkbH-like protein
MTFNELKKNLKKDYSSFKQLKLALLGDSATQFLAQAIRGAGYELQMDIKVYDVDFNQIERQILDFSSEVYKYQPDVTVIFESGHKLLQHFNNTDIEARPAFAENQLEHVKKLVNLLQSKLKTKIIWFNYAEEDDRIFGNYANKIPSSFIFQQRKLNYLLSEYAVTNSGFYICDILTIQNIIGREKLFSTSIYVNTEMVLSIDALPLVANTVVQIIAATMGRIKKCIILDLDNTLWGGIVGDDGVDKIQIGGLGIGKAFTEFQYWIKKLQQRGIIVCICSKNTESIAKEAFEKHPDMILRLTDIAVFIANWENKSNNIKRIQQILNIGFDSMVFLDDSQFERNMVRQNFPEITVPELPPDPADFLEYLYSLNLFETASYSTEDANRTEQYRKEAERSVAQDSFSNENDFLKSLNMLSDVQPFNSFSIPRIAQLTQRSNQFNLRTVRYTEEDIKNIVSSGGYITFSFTLEDKYGDNGLICVIILEKRQPDSLFIDTWLMSCRVIKRGVEKFVMNTIVDYARSNGYKTIIGEYIPTAKNVIVKNHYSGLGFIQVGSTWRLDTAMYQSKECFINIKENIDYGKTRNS